MTYTSFCIALKGKGWVCGNSHGLVETAEGCICMECIHRLGAEVKKA